MSLLISLSHFVSDTETFGLIFKHSHVYILKMHLLKKKAIIEK